MSILSKLSNLSKASTAQTPMSPEQIEACKTAIRNNGYGYNVHPNSFDIASPYRVAINYNDKWANFGNYSSSDVAAAIGTIVSAAYFGDKAKAGQYDAAKAEAHPEFQAFMADSRNATIIAQASGELPQIHQSAPDTTRFETEVPTF
jgi:hypothetical protein